MEKKMGNPSRATFHKANEGFVFCIEKDLITTLLALICQGITLFSFGKEINCCGKTLLDYYRGYVSMY
jgi:hypothetical protein